VFVSARRWLKLGEEEKEMNENNTKKEKVV
jgi:hypothetical protein